MSVSASWALVRSQPSSVILYNTDPFHRVWRSAPDQLRRVHHPCRQRRDLQPPSDSEAPQGALPLQDGVRLRGYHSSGAWKPFDPSTCGIGSSILISLDNSTWNMISMRLTSSMACSLSSSMTRSKTA